MAFSILAIVCAGLTALTMVFAIISTATTRWFSIDGSTTPDYFEFFREIEITGLSGGLWRACVRGQFGSEDISECGPYDSGSKLDAVRVFAVLTIIAAAVATMCSTVALYNASKATKFTLTITAGITALFALLSIAIYPSTLSPLPDGVSKTDALDWSYWLMIVAFILSIGGLIVAVLYQLIGKTAESKPPTAQKEEESV